jgi:hypothetical protein
LLEENAIKTSYFKNAIETPRALFMDIEIKSWFYDFLNAIEEINPFVQIRPTWLLFKTI